MFGIAAGIAWVSRSGDAGSTLADRAVGGQAASEGGGGDVRIWNPSGIIVAGAEAVATPGGGVGIERCRVIRTQRRLMGGFVTVPAMTGRAGVGPREAGERSAVELEA